jgi:hypothetical protein
MNRAVEAGSITSSMPKLPAGDLDLGGIRIQHDLDDGRGGS